jgi:hypothetical protein
MPEAPMIRGKKQELLKRHLTTYPMAAQTTPRSLANSPLTSVGKLEERTLKAKIDC